MSVNGQYYDPKVSQPPQVYQGSQPMTQPYYNSSQPQMQQMQMQPPMAPQMVHVNINQTQKKRWFGLLCMFGRILCWALLLLLLLLRSRINARRELYIPSPSAKTLLV
ncbi:hypothetical protein C8J57DRAFT_1471610 [Mycena rebaudengoi]|nr:hypothetical protein C8J57DRAFT_1471610 [Mycena rebaudengoi]